MKFIGNQIYQWISRFRNDVYLEDLATSTEQSYLVVDSEGKITKRTTLNSGSSDITTTGDVNSTNVIITGEIRGPAVTVIDPAVVGNNTGVLQIKGDLQVDGTTTTINSTTLTVDDKNIVLSSGSTTSLASDGSGITIDGASATLTYTHSDTSWNFNKNLNIDSPALVAGTTLNINNNYGESNKSITFTHNNGVTEVAKICAYGRANTAIPPYFLIKVNDTVSGGSNTVSSSDRLKIQSDGTFIFNTVGGDEKIRISSDGKVGIGTSSPTEKLHVNGNITLGNNKKITFGDSAGSAFTSIDYTSNTLFKIVQANSGELRLSTGFNDNANNKITFYTQGSSERMRITNGGNVGIGTTAPSAMVHAVSPDGNTHSLKLGRGDNSSDPWFFNHAGNDLRIYNPATSGSHILLGVDAGGNAKANRVGINTAVPNYPLHVQGAAMFASPVHVGSVTNAIVSGSGDLFLNNSKMVVTSAGRVGIGITPSVSVFQISHDSNHTSGNISISNSAFDIFNPHANDVDEKGSILTFSDNYFDSSGAQRTIRAAIKGGTDTTGNTGNGFLAFYTDSSTADSATERMRINKDGNVGIGTNSPAHKLEVREGDIHFENTASSNTFVDAKGSSANAYFRAFSDSNSVWLYQGGTSSYLSAQSGSTLRINSGTTNLILSDDSGAVLSFSSGVANFTGRIAIQGTADEALQLKVTDDGPVYHSYYRGSTDRHAYVGFGSSGDVFSIANEESGGSVRILSGGSLALNIGSDQAAVFEGTVKSKGTLTIENSFPQIALTDNNHDDDWRIRNNNGHFEIYNETDNQMYLRADENIEGIQLGDGINFRGSSVAEPDWTNNDGSSTTQNSGHSGTIVKNMFFNPASEGDPARLPHIVNDLSGFTFWGTITTSGFYSTRSGSSGNFTYSNEITNTNGGWVNAFDGFSSTAGSWYSDNGADGTTAGVGTVELQWTNEATYGFWVGIVFGSNSFIATRVKIEAYQTDAGWQTLCDLTDNNEIVVLRKVKGNSGTGQGTTRIKYTLGGSTNNSYFRIHTLYAASYQAGNVNLSNLGLEKVRGIQYLQKYGNGQIWGHFRPAQDGVYDLGSSSLEWNNGYFDGTVYADGLSLATTTISASGSTYNLNNFLRADQNDTFNGKLTYGGSDFSDAIDLSEGDLNNVNELNAYEFKQRNTGEPRSNLGTPTVTEMALFEQQFKPQTTLANNYDDLTDLKFFIQETSSSSMTEVTSYSDDNKRKFLRTNNSGVIIPNGTYKFRVQFKAYNYTFVNALYGYFATQSHKTKVHVYKFNVASNSEISHTSSDTQVSSWPGHLFLPMSQIPWHETNTTSTSHHRDVIIEFIPEWIPYSGSGTDYSDRDILLYGLQLWGGYPVGRRTPHSYDQNGKLDLFGDLGLKDNGKITLGDSDDLQIFHVGGNSYIDDAGTGDLILRTNGTAVRIQHAGEMIFKGIANGAVESYFNNTKRFETNASGVTVFPTGAAGIQMGVDSSNSVLSGRLFFENGTSGQGNTIFNNTGNLIFCTGATHGSSSGSEKIRLLANGNLGIGTSSPGNKLDVVGDVKVRNTGSGNNATLFIDTVSGGNADSILNFREATVDRASLYWDGGDNDLYLTTTTGDFLINPSGNVGIGTNTPHNNTHIVSTSSGDGLLIDCSNGSNNNFTGVYFKIDNNTTNAYKKGGLVWERTGSYNEGRFHFLLNNEDNVNNVGLSDSKMTILSTGNVGVGVTNPGSLLQVNSYTGSATDGAQSMYGGGLSIFTNSGTTDLFMGVKNASYANRGWSFKTTEVGVNSKLELVEHGLSGTRLTIASGGNATFAGNITFGDSHFIGDDSFDNLHILGSSGENIVIQAQGSTSIFLKNDSTSSLILDSSSNATFAGAATIPSQITTGYGVKFTNGNTDFLLYNNSGEDVLYMRDTTNGAMITTWKTDRFQSDKDFVAMADATIAGNLTVNGGTVILNSNVTATGTMTASSYKISSATILSGSTNVTLGSGGATGTISLTTHTSTPFKIEGDDTILISSQIKATDGTSSAPAYTFNGFTDDGIYREVYDTTKTQINFATEGSRRLRINEAGIFSDANVYFLGDLRTFGSLWHATTGTSGAGFEFKNTADNTVALTLSSTGNAAFGGNISGADGTFNGNVIVSGNLTVSGTTVTVDTTNLNVQDKNITLNYSTGDSSSTANGAGITIQDAVSSSTDATILWDTTGDKFDFSHGASFASNVTLPGFILDGNTISGIDDSGEFTDDDNHIMTSAGIHDKYSFASFNTISGTFSYDDYSARGLYRFQGGTDGPAGGSHTTGIVVTENSGNYGFQLVTNGSGDNTEKLYYRYKSSTYENWQTIVTKTFADNRYLKLSGGTITGDLFLNGSGNYIYSDISDNSLKFADSTNLKIGTGNDLQLFHNGTDSVIDNFGGNLYISQKAAGKDIILRADNGSGGFTKYLTLDGGDTRTNVHKNLRFDDNIGAVFGSGAALKLHSDGSNGIIDGFQGILYIRQQVDDQDIVFQSDDGNGSLATYFYLDGSIVENRFAKATRHSDNIIAKFGDGNDMNIYSDGTNGIISVETDDADLIFKGDNGSGGTTNYFVVDGSAEQTRFYKDTRHTDGIKANFGNSDDLRIHHDGSNSYIEDSGTGVLVIGSSQTNFQVGSANKMIIGTNDITVLDDIKLSVGTGSDLQIYHDGSNSYITDNGTGDLLVSSFTLQGTGRIQGVDTVSAGTDAANKTYVDAQVNAKTESFILACSDETTDLTASSSVAKVTFRMPYAFTLTNVRANVSTAPEGSTLTVDIKRSGTSIFSTALTIANGSKTSVGGTAHEFAGSADTMELADDAEITVFCTAVGSTAAGKGLKVTLIGNQ